MKEFNRILRKNLIGNQKFSNLLLKRALLKGYYIKFLQIDPLLQKNFQKFKTNLTMARIFKRLTAVGCIKMTPTDQGLQIFSDFLSHRSCLRRLILDFTAKKDPDDKFSNQEMIQMLILRMFRKGYNKGLTILHLDLYQDQIKKHLDYRLCRSISGFCKIESIKLNFNGKDYQVSDKVMVRFLKCVSKFKNMVALPFHINRLPDVVCQIVLNMLNQHSDRLKKVHIEGFIDEKMPVGLDLLTKSLPKKSLERLNISLHDYSGSKDVTRVISTVENTVTSMISLVHLMLKLDFKIPEEGLIRILESLVHEKNLIYLGLSTLGGNITNQALIVMGEVFQKMKNSVKSFSLTVVGGDFNLSKKALTEMGRSIGFLEKLEYLRFEFSKNKKQDLKQLFSSINTLNSLQVLKLKGNDNPQNLTEFGTRHRETIKIFKIDLKLDAKLMKSDFFKDKKVEKENLVIKKFTWRFEMTQTIEIILSALKNYKNLEKMDIRNKLITITPETWKFILVGLSRAKKLEKFTLQATFNGFGDDLEKALQMAGFTNRFRHIVIVALVEGSDQPVKFEVHDHDLWLY